MKRAACIALVALSGCSAIYDPGGFVRQVDGGRDGGMGGCTRALDCDDRRACNGVESCDFASGTCVPGAQALTGTPCSEGTGTVCVEGLCVAPVCGNTVIEPGEQCDDGANGNSSDGCTDECKIPCVSDLDCASLSNQCNRASCSVNVCVVTVITGTCSDNDPCTDGDACQNGLCRPTGPKDCTSFSNACSVGSCNPATGTCFSSPVNGGAACDDVDPCTTGTMCSSGACTGGAPTDCSPLNGACTMGLCDVAAGGCVASPINEGAACMGGSNVCQNGTCIPCGGIGQPCCAGSCSGTLSCANNICQDCGEPGEQCCGGATSCRSPATCSGANCCLPLGQPCTSDGQCCSLLCGGTCFIIG